MRLALRIPPVISTTAATPITIATTSVAVHIGIRAASA